MEQEKKVKVYFAILNKGWIRREIVWSVIPAVMTTPGAEITWENPSKSYAHPISSNRNRIVKRFLQTDCDYLLMLDNDVIPYQNPVELVLADKDIIGVPAKVRQKGHSLNWVAYYHAEGDTREGYTPVDFSLVDPSVDILSVDIIGTGCILIKRKVLETLKAPFHLEFDEDGITTFGTDFAFCRKAKKAGFEVYTTVQRRAEHIKEFGLNDINSYDDADYRDVSPAKYGWPWGEWAITQKDWHFIRDIIRDVCPDRILEFGAGLSSLLMSEQNHVTSYEVDEEYLKIVEDKKDGNYLDLRLWDGKNLEERLKYGLCFVDGPKGRVNGGPGRQYSIKYASELSDHIIVHDAGRNDEMMWQNKYLRHAFNLVASSGSHVTRCHYWRRK